MVLVAIKNVKNGKYKLVLIMNQLLQKLDVIRVLETIPGQTVDIVHQLLFPLG